MGWKKGFPGVFIDFRPPGDLALDHFFGDSAPKLIPLFVKKHGRLRERLARQLQEPGTGVMVTESSAARKIIKA